MIDSLGPLIGCLLTLAVLVVVKEDKVCNMCCTVALPSSFSAYRTKAARLAIPVTEVSTEDIKQLDFSIYIPPGIMEGLFCYYTSYCRDNRKKNDSCLPLI